MGLRADPDGGKLGWVAGWGLVVGCQHVRDGSQGAHACRTPPVIHHAAVGMRLLGGIVMGTHVCADVAGLVEGVQRVRPAWHGVW